MPSADARASAAGAALVEVSELGSRSRLLLSSASEHEERPESVGDVGCLLGFEVREFVAVVVDLDLEVVGFVAEEDFGPDGRPRLRVSLGLSVSMLVSVSRFVTSLALLDLDLAFDFDLLGRGGEKDGRARFGAGAMVRSTSHLQSVTNNSKKSWRNARSIFCGSSRQSLFGDPVCSVVHVVVIKCSVNRVHQSRMKARRGSLGISPGIRIIPVVHHRQIDE
jgi:hypothetical protein